MPLIEISKLSFSYDTEPIVSDASLSIEPASIISLLGPSGCGKSTLLRLIAGLEIPLAGQIKFAAIPTCSPSDSLRLLFQDYDAYPWFTVQDNIRFGSGPKPFPSVTATQEMLDRVGLSASAKRYPAELSGGMKKRLGLARCLIRCPSLMLLDEPFSSLDFEAKCEMYDLVQKLRAENQSTVLMVTHDVHEAILLSDQILISSVKPLHIVDVVEVPFGRYRDDTIIDTSEYRDIRHHITNAFHRSSISR
jgi:NitT/TauT family transport system ATP-binding protein